MNIELLLRGQKFFIYGLVGNDGSCPILDFLNQLKLENPACHRSIFTVLERHASSGPILNKKKSRSIKGHNDLYEFKSPQGARLPYFYLPGGKTVITHGFKKGSLARVEFKKAANLLNQYLEELRNEQC